jgi:WD40 repeat protein
MMLIPQVNPEDFCRADTRRIRTFAAAASGPMVVGAGGDGRVYVWDVEARTRVCEFPTSEDSGGVSVALTPQGRECFVGTYYAWGVACLDVASQEKRWHRTDLKKVYGLATSADGNQLISWFDGRAGLGLDSQTGQSCSRDVGLRMFAASRFDGTELKYKRRFELSDRGRLRHKWPRDSFALLSCAFSPQLCVVSESGVPAKAIELTSGRLAWVYQSRDGAHLTELDFSPRLKCFVALEYAYTEAGRDTGPMVALLHLDVSGNVIVRQTVREWSDAVFCADGAFLLNGLGELYDTSTAALTHVFEFPR